MRDVFRICLTDQQFIQLFTRLARHADAMLQSRVCNNYIRGIDSYL